MNSSFGRVLAIPDHSGPASCGAVGVGAGWVAGRGGAATTTSYEFLIASPALAHANAAPSTEARPGDEVPDPDADSISPGRFTHQVRSQQTLRRKLFQRVPTLHLSPFYRLLKVRAVLTHVRWARWPGGQVGSTGEEARERVWRLNKSALVGLAPVPRSTP